jgi:hypothetical protein
MESMKKWALVLQYPRVRHDLRAVRTNRFCAMSVRQSSIAP